MSPIALVFAVLLAGAAAQPTPTPTPTPAATPAPVIPNGAKLGMEQTAFDVGEVTRPTKISHDFVVTNPGTGDLMIEVRPSCGCTVADYDKIVKPGKTGKVSLSVDTSRFEGKVTKMATLTSNDPAKASVSLSIGGTIKVP